MLLRLFRRIHPLSCLHKPFRFCSQIIPTAKQFTSNPYDNYPKQHLLFLAKSGQLSVNELILLSNSLSKHNQTNHSVYIFISKHLYNTPDVLFGTFLAAYHTGDNIPDHLLKFYIQVYCQNNRNCDQDLKVTELLHNRVRKWTDQSEHYYHNKAKEVNKFKMVDGYFRAQVMNIQQLIKFARFFKDQVGKEELSKQIYEKYQPLKNNEDIILLAYLTKDIDSNISIQPSLDASTPKSICLLCELAYPSHKQGLNLLLNSITFNQFWNYQTIVWISEFLPAHNNKLEQAHNYLIKNCNLTDISTLMIYARRIPSYMRSSLCDWLCRQQKYLYETFETEDLIDVLQFLPEDEFKPYLQMLMKEARGNYQWEEINKLYYYAKVWKIESEHTESLRIYLANGYISLGVQRRGIPTSSFYFKVIEIVSPDQLFKFKVDFGGDIKS